MAHFVVVVVVVVVGQIVPTSLLAWLSLSPLPLVACTAITRCARSSIELNELAERQSSFCMPVCLSVRWLILRNKHTAEAD